MHFNNDGSLHNDNRRKLAAITNRDWALSEIYFFVKGKTQVPTDGEVI